MNYTLKVIEIRKETEDAVTLCFKQPGLKKIKYLAGQYLTLIFRINGRRYIRPYSFSSCPGVDAFLEVTIKRVRNGIVSNHVNDIVKEGDSIEVMSPMGDFTYDESKGFKSVYLWGVGSGVTPLFSIAKLILNAESDTTVHLAYGNKGHESTIFLNQLKELSAKYQGRFLVKHFHTRLVVDQSNPNLVEGRIDQQKALAILEDDQFVAQSAHYICGPAGLKESVKSALLSKNINAEQIFSEDFELVKNPKDFENISTQSIDVSFEGKKYTLEVTKGKSVLESALNADIELPYSCMTGNCSTCKGKLVTGALKMIGLTKDRNDLNADEYLLCCAHPLSENVSIEI